MLDDQFYISKITTNRDHHQFEAIKSRLYYVKKINIVALPRSDQN